MKENKKKYEKEAKFEDKDKIKIWKEWENER